MKLVKLGNLTSIQTGKIDVNKAVVGGKYPFFTCSRDVYEINDAPFEGKAVLVAGNGDLNVKYYEGKFNAYQRTYFLFVNDEKELLPRYLYWFLESHVGQLRSEAIGSTIKYIKMGNLTDAEIPLPPLEKQKEIVEKLDKAAVEMDLLDENLSMSDEKANLLMQSLLSLEFTFSGDSGQPDSPRVKQVLGVNSVSKPLGDLCTLTMGRTPPRGNSRYWDSSRKTKNIWISIADMTKSLDGILIDSKEYLSDEGSNSFPKVKAGTLLLSFKLSVGKLAIAGADLQTNEAIMAMNELNEDLILRDYLYYFLLGFDWSEALEGRFKVKGNTLNKKILEELRIKFPSIERQRAIVAKLDIVSTEVESLKAQIKFQRDHAAALRQSLLYRAFIVEKVVA